MSPLRVAEANVAWPVEVYRTLEDVLRERAGLIFTPLRRSTVETAANRVMRRVGIKTPETFVELVTEDGAVFDDLMAEVTIGETYFFREPAQFDLLRKTIVPAFRAKHPPDRAFRAWSAGCSTGEEPYSIAILLREIGLSGYVVGSDISRTRLSIARRGEYRSWSFRGVPDALINRHFQKVEDTFVLAPEIRRAVEFRYLNLAADAFPAMSSGVWGMDLILCRNVLIYFDRESIARVAEAMLATLADDGWLVLGASDPPLGEIARCEVVQTPSGLAYQKYRPSAARRVQAPLMPPIAPQRHEASEAGTADIAPRVNPAEQLAHIAKEIMLVEKQAVEKVVQPIAASESLAMRAYLDRDYERAAAMASQRISAGEATVADLVVNVRALANLGHLDEAAQACAAALDQNRDNPQLHYMHAVLLAEKELFAESARAAKRALYLDRNVIVAHLALGAVIARWGKDIAAAQRSFAAAERLLSAMPSDQLVPDSDGEPAGRLLEMTRAQSRLLPGASGPRSEISIGVMPHDRARS